MTVAASFGGALVLSGWLFSRGIGSVHRARTIERLGAERPEPGSASSWIAAMWPRFRAGRERFASYGVTALGAFLGFHLVGPIGLVAGSIIGPVVIRSRRARAAVGRKELLDRQLAEAVGAVAAAVRAGLSVRRAVDEAARGAEPPLHDELETVVRRVENGEPLDSALARLDRRLRLSDASLVVTALAVHRKTGGDLPRLLDEIEHVIRARLEERSSVRALTAQARSSGVVLAVLPIAFVALLSGTGGDGLGAFYRTPLGAELLFFSFGCQILGFGWMRRIVRRVEWA